MCLAVDIQQLRRVDVRVALRGGELHVAEQLLDRAQIGAALEQVRRKRMPQRVRADPEARAARGDISGDEPLHTPPGQTCPPKVDEQRFGLSSQLWALDFGLWALDFGLWALGFWLWALGLGLWALTKDRAVGKPRANRLLSGVVERHQAFLRALPHHTHHPCTQIHFVEIEADQLAQPQARRIEQLEDRPITASERR